MALACLPKRASRAERLQVAVADCLQNAAPAGTGYVRAQLTFAMRLRELVNTEAGIG